MSNEFKPVKAVLFDMDGLLLSEYIHSRLYFIDFLSIFSVCP